MTFKTYELTEEQMNAAKELVEGNKRAVGNFTCEEVDEDMVLVWIDYSEDDEYSKFLIDALDNGATIYTLYDNLGGMSQPLGEFVVFD